MNATDNVELAPDPETGELKPVGSTLAESAPAIVNGGAPAPRRSWKRNRKGNNSYDGRFHYEGATIYIQSLDEEVWGELEAREEALQDESDSIAQRMEALADMEAGLRRQRRIAREEGSPTPEADAALDELRRERRELNRRSKEAAKQLAEFQEYVVQSSVVGWKGAPEAYSAQAVKELPLEMVAHWAAIILEKSRVGRSDADFLPGS